MWLWEFVLATALVAPSIAIAADPPTSVSNQQQSDLTDIIAYYFPTARAEAILKQGCAEDYRVPSEAERNMEKEIPGILDRMIQAETEYCDRSIGPYIEARQDKIKSDWATALSPADLSLLARLLRQVVQVLTQPGIADPAVVGMKGLDDQKDRRLKAFDAIGKTRREAELMSTAVSYMARAKTENDDSLRDFFRAARRAAQRAANAYGDAAGFETVYPNVPPSGPAL